MIPCWDHLSLAMIHAQSDLNLYPIGDSLFSSWIPTESSPEKNILTKEDAVNLNT